jgi:hypothetical protein
VLHNIEFSAKNHTSNAGLVELQEHGNMNGIFGMMASNRIFVNTSTNTVKMDPNKTMLCCKLVGFEKPDRLILLQIDFLVNEVSISIKKPETVSIFLGNFSRKTSPEPAALAQAGHAA